MVTEVKCCHKSGLENVVKNDSIATSNPKYKCKACGFGGVIQTMRASEDFKETVVRADQVRSSSRGLVRTFGIRHQTALNRIKKKSVSLPNINTTLLQAKKRDVLELNELWWLVYAKAFNRWIWIALCRRTRQVASYFIGDRSIDTCRKFWNLILQEYRRCKSFSDYWEAYVEVITTELNRMIGKKSGQSCHLERWNNTLRIRICRFIRKTLSFSKSDTTHELYLHLFIHNYN